MSDGVVEKRGKVWFRVERNEHLRSIYLALNVDDIFFFFYIPILLVAQSYGIDYHYHSIKLILI